MTAKLDDEVLQPLDKWVASYRATKDKNHRCEALRVEWDAQKKTVTNAEERHRTFISKGDTAAASKAAANVQTEKDKEARESPLERHLGTCCSLALTCTFSQAWATNSMPSRPRSTMR